MIYISYRYNKCLLAGRNRSYVPRKGEHVILMNILYCVDAVTWDEDRASDRVEINLIKDK